MASRQKKKQISVSKIRMLSELQCTEAEAAASLGLRLKTFKEMIRIDTRAREAWESGRELGKLSIRRSQFRLSTHNATMAIFLGKQYLGQNEVNVLEMSGRNGGPIKTLDLAKLDRAERSGLRQAILKARGPSKK